MLDGLNGLSETTLLAWIESSLSNGSHQLAAGYQGQTLLYQDDQYKLVIKVPHGRGLARYFHIRMLKHEHAIYQKLKHFSAAPRCHGLLAGQYLILAYINAPSLRQSSPEDEPYFYAQLLLHIKNLHQLGVAHMDLKKKDNLLVANGREPILIDFGAAVEKKAVWHIFNRYWYQLAVRFDFNAWIKLKYKRQLDNLSEEDKVYYHKTWAERLAKKLKPLVHR